MYKLININISGQMDKIAMDYLLKIMKASPQASLILLPDAPYFTIIEASLAYLRVTGRTEESLLGRGCLEIFAEWSVGMWSAFQSNLRQSLETVLKTCQSDKMTTQNYGVLLAGTDKFEIRYCELENIPVLDPENKVKYIIHNVQDRIEREMSLLMNDAEDSFILLDKDLRIILFNKQFHRLYKEYLGKDVNKGDSIFDYAQPERVETLKEMYQRVLAGSNEKSDIDIPVVAGNIRSFSIKYNPAKDESGLIIGVFVTVADVTVEKELKSNQEALINNTDDFIWSLTRNYKLIAANKAFIRRMEALTGKTLNPGDDVLLWGRFQDEFMAFWQLSYEKALQGESFKREICFQSSGDIKESWSETGFNPIFNKAAITGVACYSRDITERKRIEEELVRAKNLSDSIINGLPGTFYLFNEIGQFLRWNRNFEKVTGYSAGEISGMNLVDFFDLAEKESIAQKIVQVFQKGEADIQAPLLLKSNEKLPYYFTLIAMEYEGSNCLMGLGIDLIESTRDQEKIKQITDQTHQLALHLQNVKEEERKRIGREIHDELGQQLTAIHMDVAWIDKQIPEEAPLLKEKLQNIIQLLDGSNQSLRRILSELRPGILDDYGLLDALVWLGEQFTDNTAIHLIFSTLETKVKSSEPVAECIFRVYQEALTNITRYAHATSVRTSLSIADMFIIFTIEDNGIGFDTASLRSNNSFGLLGMKERVLSLGGGYKLTSVPGKGTKITVRLPGSGSN